MRPGLGRIYAQLAAAMVAWGLTWIAGRIIATALPHPTGAAALRFFLAAAVLAALARTRGLPLWPRGRKAMLWPLVAMAFSGVWAYNLFFFYGLQHVSAGRGALVVALSPVVVAVLAWWGFGEAHRWMQSLGAALAFLGCLTVIGHGDPLAPLAGEIGWGDVLILGCVAAWSAYTFFGKRATQNFSALAATFWAALLGGILLMVTALAQGAFASIASWPPEVWGAIAFFGIFGTALGFTWYAEAVRVIGAARAALWINFVPVVAVLAGWWWLDEAQPWGVLLGGALVLTGVILTTRGGGTRQPNATHATASSALREESSSRG